MQYMKMEARGVAIKKTEREQWRARLHLFSGGGEKIISY
jgi:hypothetical protein